MCCNIKLLLPSPQLSLSGVALGIAIVAAYVYVLESLSAQSHICENSYSFSKWGSGWARMGNLTAWLRWWTLLSVVAVVTATVDNKPADGYLHSGYFWPKTLYWRGIRHPPGIYWFVFFFYFAAVSSSLNGSLLSICARASNALDETETQVFDIMTGTIFSSVTTMMGSGLLFISVAAANLSDVVQAYLIGMCIIQVIIDALRGIISCKPENFYVVYFTLISFQLSAAFGIALLDSYHPLNQLNCAYSVIGVFITLLTTAASVDEKKRFKVTGFIGASVQMVFCVLSYRIANEVADVNKKQTAAFLYTAVVNFGLVTISQMLAACAKKAANEEERDLQHL